jgi:hypothetical protein
MSDAVWIVTEAATEQRGPTTKRSQEADADPWQWFACHFPERPFDPDTCLHDCCAACVLAVTAATANGYLWAAEDGTSVVDMLVERLSEYGEADDA